MALCRSVLAICHELDLTVVAEGIETPTQAHTLRDLGCQLGQGHLYGAALQWINCCLAPPPAGAKGYFQGFTDFIDAAKSDTLRVTSVSACTCAVAAMSASMA